MITKTHSASNVFSRTTNKENTRNSLNTEVQYTNKQYSVNSRQNIIDQTDSAYNTNKNIKPEQNSVSVKSSDRLNIRRGSSVENVNSAVDINSNGNLKKLKYEAEVIINCFAFY